MLNNHGATSGGKVSVMEHKKPTQLQLDNAQEVLEYLLDVAWLDKEARDAATYLLNNNSFHYDDYDDVEE